jgi:4-amino-4-deoxy-L-arabinose transferase
MIGALLWALSAQQYQRGRRQPALGLLLMGALLLRTGTHMLDPFLHYWDEQFHALVARNLIETPLTPRLYPQAPLPYDFRDWQHSHIWLHKPPLFLWQMAGSLKLLGTNSWGVRLPSLLLGTASCGLLWAALKELIPRHAAFWAAWLMAGTLYLIETNAGLKAMEHCTTALFFYLLAALAACAASLRASTRKAALGWLLLAGVLTGCAVLSKWLVGLFPLLFWALYRLVAHRGRPPLYELIGLAGAFVLALVPYLLWQSYILTAFPQEAQHELAYNFEHLVRVTEGNGGPWWFYFRTFPLIYGAGALPLVLIGLYWAYWRLERPFFWSSLVTVLAVYAFFTAARTKLVHYVLPAAPFIFAALGLAVAELLRWGPQLGVRLGLRQASQQLFSLLLLLLIGWSFLRPYPFYDNHCRPPSPPQLPERVQHYRAAAKAGLPERTVLTKVPANEHPQAMFYTGALAYPRALSPKERQMLRSKGYTLLTLGDLRARLKAEGAQSRGQAP